MRVDAADRDPRRSMPIRRSAPWAARSALNTFSGVRLSRAWRRPTWSVAWTIRKRGPTSIRNTSSGWSPSSRRAVADSRQTGCRPWQSRFRCAARRQRPAPPSIRPAGSRRGHRRPPRRRRRCHRARSQHPGVSAPVSASTGESVTEPSASSADSLSSRPSRPAVASMTVGSATITGFRNCRTSADVALFSAISGPMPFGSPTGTAIAGLLVCGAAKAAYSGIASSVSILSLSSTTIFSAKSRRLPAVSMRSR